MEKPVRILVVEDTPEDAEGILRELRAARLDFAASRVADEDALLAALEAFFPAVVLAGDRLSHLDGSRVVQLVRSHSPGVPLIMVTGSISEETSAALIRAGASDCVRREHVGRLGSVVRSALERIRLESEKAAVEESRRRTELDLARQLSVLRAVLDSSDAAIYAVDRELRYVAFNRAHAAMMKRLYGGEIRTGSSLRECMQNAPSDWERTRANLARALAGEPTLEEAHAVGEGQARRWLTVLHNPVRAEQGQVTGAVVVAQDISQRRRQEELLGQLYRAVEQSPVSIVITDANGAIEYVNPRFEQVTGYTTEEVLGKNPSLLKSGQTPPELYADLWRAITTGGEWAGEILNRRKDGSLFWEQAHVSGIQVDGRIRNYVAVKEDITERKRASEALKHTEQLLVQAQKMEAIGRLAGGVAHDFNNLLSVIQGHGERLLSELGEGHAQLGRVEQILWSADKAAALTKQLLAFSRLQVLEPKVIRLDAVVADARRMLARVIGEDVELAVAVPDRLASVRADPAQMVQVLLNLAVNARDAMPRGGRLTLEFADVELDDRYAVGHPPLHSGRYVMLAVSDTGHGMDAETQRRVFEPFFTTKPEGQGTGLGLSTVYGIVKQSGGFVWVYSELGIGTTFKVYLPCVDEPAESPAPAVRESPGPLEAPKQGTRILLVEDDDGVRELMADILETAGYVVVAAGRPLHALELAGSLGRVDLLVTDVIMPGMSGRELARKLIEKQPGLRALYVSGYAGEALARHGGIDRGERFLQKPFSERGLLETVAAALSGHERGVEGT